MKKQLLTFTLTTFFIFLLFSIARLDAQCNVSLTTSAPYIDCNNYFVTMTAFPATNNGPATYSWNTGDTNASIDVTSAGQYVVTITDVAGCSAMASYDMFDYSQGHIVDIIGSPDAIYCEGDVAVLEAMIIFGGIGPFDYIWNTGETISSIFVPLAGYYEVQVYDVATGCITFAGIEVLDNSNPISAIITSTSTELTCTEPSATLDASTSTGGVGTTFGYQWSTGENTPSVTVNSVGLYGVTLTDEAGCYASADYILTGTQTPLSIINSNGNIDCNNPVVTLDGSASISFNGNLTYLWSTGETTPMIDVLYSGTYSLEVTDEGGCSGISFIPVTENMTNPIAIITGSEPTLPCPGAVVYLDASASTGQGALIGYEWTTGETTATIPVFNGGDYYVTVTDDENGCTSVAIYTLAEELPPYADIQASSFELNCLYASITLDGTGSFTSSGLMNYYWSTGETTPIIDVSLAGVYTLEIVDIYSGCNDILSINITENTVLPNANITASSTELNAQNPTVSLDASTSTGQGVLSYLWSDNSTASTLTVSISGLYSVTVTDSYNGCSYGDTIDITENLVDLYVDYTATGANDGSSWADAFTDLQDAIGTAGTVHVAKGTYYPTSGTTRGTAFEPTTNTTILGGYPNGGGTREPSSNETTLSGNIDGVASYAGNSYHVVSVKNVNNIILDGLSIRDGNANNANSFGRSRGGGLFVNNATLTLKDVEVKWNKAVYGGGIFATLSPNVMIEDCTFKKNTANNGSAIYHSNETNLYIDKTRIIDNNSLIRCAIEVNNSLYTRIDNSVIANNASGNANAIAFIATNRDGSCDIYNTTVLGETKNKFLITMQVGFGDQLDVSLYNSIIAHQNPAFSQTFKDFNNGVLNLNTTNCYIMDSAVLGNSSNNLYSTTAGDLVLNADYSLGACSPGVDDGGNTYASGNTDINGVVRIINTVDIGAYENVLACRTKAKKNGALVISEVSVFPNPTQNKISIQTDIENPTFHLFDLLGKKVLNTKAKEINLGQLPQGIYILRIMEGNELIESVKVIKN